MQLQNVVLCAVLLVLSVDLISAFFRIIGGSDTNIEDQPWAVSLQLNGKHFCGGVIISSTKILTAAHCLKGKKISKKFKILAGTNNASDTESGTYVGVKRALVHSLYDTETNDYDIALIKVNKRLEFSKRIQRIKLADEDYQISPGDQLTASGWGTLKPNLKRSSPILQSVVVNSIDWRECKNRLSRVNLFSSRMICAGMADGGKDSCKGDSGGPLEANGILYGITSWGIGCGDSKWPGTYTNVGYFRDWIQKYANV